MWIEAKNMEGSNNLKVENQQDIRRVMMSSNLIIIFKEFDTAINNTLLLIVVMYTFDFAHTHLYTPITFFIKCV